MNRIYHIIALTIAILLLSSCEDKLEWNGGPIPEGYTDADITVGYAGFTPALQSRAAGNAIKDIKSLWVVLFDEAGEYVDKYKITSFTLANNTRPDGTPSSETMTGRASFSLRLPNGRWRMYAVANYDLDPEFSGNMQSLQKLPCVWMEGNENVAKNAQMFGYFTNTDGKSDADMPASDVNDTDETNSFTAPVVTVMPGKPLHAWVRRAASKLTVAFNTDRLKDNVFIYIKSIAIKDIPKECYLGFKNSPVTDENRVVEGISDELLDTGETIYMPGADASQKWEEGDKHYQRWLELNKGMPVIGMHTVEHPEDIRRFSQPDIPRDTLEMLIAREHTESVPALYFYENNQGYGKEGTLTDKRQDVSGNNKQISFPDGVHAGGKGWKDGKESGTWVEIEGYYMCQDSIQPGKGPIKYRFMLGKDHITDYNAERNHHYRLTLTFNGYANNVDFHIEYKEEAKPGFLIPPVTYVSYLYNQDAFLTGRATPKEGYKLKKVEAVIIKNHWIPYTVDDADSAKVVYNRLAWQMQQTGKDSYAGGAEINRTLDPECEPNCEFGWLSLRKITTVSYNLEGSSTNFAKMVQNFRKIYFTPDANDVGGSKGKRTLDEIPQAPTPPEGMLCGDKQDGFYTVHLEERKLEGRDKPEKNYIINIPLFTRAKSLDSWGVYSGANPYNQHYRYARVKYTAYYISEKGEDDPDNPPYTDIQYGDVFQSRRIDNPRAVYRRHGNMESFQATLMYSNFQVHDEITMEGDETVFQRVVSNGPWSATIECDPTGIVELKGGGQTARGVGNAISGRTGSFVDFTINQIGVVNELQPAGAIVTVRYHNNSCVHKIIVRRGYAPSRMQKQGTAGKYWACFNLYNTEELCYSPLSVGSFFKRAASIQYPIAEINNRKDNFDVGEIPGPNATYTILNAGGDTEMKWADITGFKRDQVTSDKSQTSANAAFGEFEVLVPGYDAVNKVKVQAPDMQDILDDVIDNNDINFAFGIAYGDGATKTLDTANAYLFSDVHNNGNKDELEINERGVRAVVAYSLTHADNIIFPLGARGHARRKASYWSLRSDRSLSVNGNQGYGYLRYGTVDVRLGGDDGQDKAYNNYRPMAYDLPSQFGAIYWANKTWANRTLDTGASADDHYIAIDFNYGNYMTGILRVADHDLYSTDGYSDAVPIRPVRIEVIE